MITQFLKKILKRLFGDFHAKYIPLLMVYFAYGASGLIGIALTFWEKERLTALNPADLAVIAFWAGLPWTVKMVFGQFADSIRILGHGRKIYIFIGAGLIALSYEILVGIETGFPFLMRFGKAGELYRLAMIIAATGYVLQDVIADAMSTEVVDRRTGIIIGGKLITPAEADFHLLKTELRLGVIEGLFRTKEDINTEINHVQWLGRVALAMASVIVAGLGGWLVAVSGYKTMFIIANIIPLISITGAIFVRPNPVPRTPINWWILGGGIAFAIFIISVDFFDIPYGTEIIFGVSLGVVCFMLSKVGTMTKVLVLSAAALFFYRAVPGAGPGVSWWMIDVLKFDKAFQGTLQQIGAAFGLFGLFALRKYIIQKPISFTLICLTIAGAILSLPTIGMYYGLHEKLGLSARTVALVDTTISGPLGHLSMVPMLAIIARICQAGHAGTMFALMASLMNLALSCSYLGTKYLNQIWIVTREVKNAAGAIITPQDYSQLGHLMIASWLIGLIVPLAAIYFFLRKIPEEKKQPDK